MRVLTTPCICPAPLPPACVNSCRAGAAAERFTGASRIALAVVPAESVDADGVVTARFVSALVPIGLAAGVRVSVVSRRADAFGHVVDHATFGVVPARVLCI